MSNQDLEAASQLIHAGRVEQARPVLEQLIKRDVHNIQAWSLYAQTCSDINDKIRIWEVCLKHNPVNPLAAQALAYLTSSQRQERAIQQALERSTPANSSAGRGQRFSYWLVAGWMGILVLGALLAVVAVLSKAATNPERYRHDEPVEYYLYVPKEYKNDTEWPLFIGVHGAGGTGLNCWNLWQSYADEEGFILLCPTVPGIPDGTYPEIGKDIIWSAVNEVKSKYRIQQRMFLAGVAGGGYMVQDFMYHYPQSVSGLSILSTATYLDPKQFQEYVPILIVNQEQDHPIVLYNSAAFSNQLNDLGFDYIIMILPPPGQNLSGLGIEATFELFRKTLGKDSQWDAWAH